MSTKKNLSGSLASIFIDFENFLLALVNTHKHTPADAQAKTLTIIGQVEKFLSDQGVQVALRSAYADWSQYPDALRELYRMGVQAVNVASTPRKNSADIELSLSVQGVMLGRPDINVLVVMAGDRDYMPITIRAEAQAKALLFISFRDSLSGDLKKLVGQDSCFYVNPQTGNIGEDETVPTSKGRRLDVSLVGGPGDSKDLSVPEVVALNAAITASDKYKPKYGDVKLSGFLLDGLARELPGLSHLERKQVFDLLKQKGLVRTNAKTGIYGEPFVVFSVEEDHPMVKMVRSSMSDSRSAKSG